MTIANTQAASGEVQSNDNQAAVSPRQLQIAHDCYLQSLAEHVYARLLEMGVEDLIIEQVWTLTAYQMHHYAQHTWEHYTEYVLPIVDSCLKEAEIAHD